MVRMLRQRRYTSECKWQRSNDPHKLTKAAGLQARRRSRLGRLQLHAGVTSAALGSSHCVFVAAAAAPPLRQARRAAFAA